jgi:gas vesicle protein
MKTGKVLVGALAGLAVGALAGILFASEKGSTTRRQIKDRGADFVDELKTKFDEFRHTFTEKFKSAKNDAEELVDNGKAKFDDAKKVVKNVTDSYKHDATAY